MSKSIRVWRILLLASLIVISMLSIPSNALGGNISVSSTPSGANIYLDGSYKGTTPKTLTEVSASSHTIKLTLNEYDDWTTNVNVVEGSTATVSATLIKTAISVSSTPSGAKIYLDGTYKGVTPFTITRVSAGSHTVKLTLNEYDDWTTNVNVVEGNTATVSATLLKTTISISSTPFGAKIYLDGTYKGITPLNIIQVPSGSHTIKLTLDQYDDWTTTVNAIEGTTTTVSANLTKKSPTQTLTPTETPIIPTPFKTPTITPTYTTPVPSATPTPTYTSQPQNVPDNTPPSISLTTQIVDFNKNGQLEEGEKLLITYGAKDESGVKSIKLLLDGDLIESRNNEGTYQTTTDSLSIGIHTIVVEAVDSNGNKNSEKKNITAARLGPSVYFPKSIYELREGEDFKVDLSAVNPTGPKMEALLIIKPPGNGVSIYESWCKGLEGMCTGKYEIEPGDTIRSISMRMRADKAGEYQIDAEVYYQFDDGQRSPTRYETLTLVVKPKSQQSNLANTQAQAPSTPGFEFVNGIFGLLVIVLMRSCRKVRRM